MGQPSPGEELPFVEPFTPRETDILALLAEGMSDREIADCLVVATSTVKWYNRQIYDKLGVSGREQAVERATTLGLLDTSELSTLHEPHNLPAQTTPFIGREQELVQLADLLADPEVRLITILAPGGMGKTRLALEAAARQSSQFADGVYFVPLAPLASPDHIIPAIAKHTSYPIQPDNRDPKQQVLDFLRHKHLLLVLDNCEHLLDGMTLVAEILQTAPNVQVLATSRERLRLSGETVYTVGGMRIPEEGAAADAQQHDAIRLFVQGARQVCPDFTLSQDNISHAASICRLVDGLPLAIVLAAAWMEVLSPAEIADEIARSFDFLVTEMRDVPRRHWSIRAVFEPTWQRLTAYERTAFMRCSVFRGGCTRQAAQAVTGVDLPTLNRLVNKALLTREPDGRYAMHELLRQFAARYLKATGDRDAVQGIHSRYYAEAMHQRENDLKYGQEAEMMKEIERDFENVRAGWVWATQQGQFGILDLYLWSMNIFLFCEPRIQEARELFSSVARTMPSDHQGRTVYGRILRCFSYAILQTGLGETNLESARDALLESLAIARQFDQRQDMALALSRLGETYIHIGHDQKALEAVEESLAISRDINDKWGLSDALASHTYVKASMGVPPGELESLLQERLALAHESGNRLALIAVLNDLGVLHAIRGQHKQAYEYYQQTLTLGHELSLRYLPRQLSNLADAAYSLGYFEEAHHLVGDLLSAGIKFGDSDVVGGALLGLANLALGDGSFTEADQLVQRALSQFQRPGDWQSLIERKIIHGWVLCASGDFQAAQPLLADAFEELHRRRRIDMLPDIIGGLAILLAHQGQPDQAAAVLSCYLHLPMIPAWYKDRHALLVELQTHLKAALGEAEYSSAWGRGKSLDLQTVTHELLAIFGSDE